MTDLVSIIVINYNTFRVTSDCIASVIAHTHGVPYEIILVDNGSGETDPKRFVEAFPSITLVACKKNLGFSKGNNEGISRSKGNYVLLLNSDTLLKDDSITTLYAEMNKRPGVAVASGKLLFPDGRVQGVCQNFPSIRMFLFEATRLQKLVPKNVKGKILLGSFFDYETECEPDWVWGTFMMIRRSAIEALPDGKLNDDYFMYGEDMQWCMDFNRKGLKVFYTPRASVIHLMRGSSANTMEMVAKNFIRFLETNYNGVHAAALKVIYRFYYKLL
jgi:GT2 family glycosyltransferase